MFNKARLRKTTLLFPLLFVLYEIATYLSTDAYLPALPYIARDLNASHHLIALTLTTWFMGSASMQLFLGPLSDRIGRRPVLLFGALVFVFITIGCALTHNIYTLLVLRFIQGATISSMIVAGYAAIHELLNREEAIHALAIMNSIIILAPAFGPLLGAIILSFTNWRWIFGLLALWVLLVLVGLFFKMPETRNVSQKKMQFKQILVQYKNILFNKSFMLFNLIFQSLFATMLAWITAGPFLIINRFHFKTFSFAIMQGIIFGCFIMATRFVKQLMKTLSLQTIINIGTTLALLGGVYVLMSSLIWPNILWNMIIAMMLLATGSGLTFPILNRLAIESSSEPMGARVAMSSLIQCTLGALGSGLVSTFYNNTLFSLAAIFFTFSIISVILQVIHKKQI